MADLYEAICAKDSPAGWISLHVPVICIDGLYYNANTGLLEPWVEAVGPMFGARRKMFETIAKESEAKVRARLERST